MCLSRTDIVGASILADGAGRAAISSALIDENRHENPRGDRRRTCAGDAALVRMPPLPAVATVNSPRKGRSLDFTSPKAFKLRICRCGPSSGFCGVSLKQIYLNSKARPLLQKTLQVGFCPHAAVGLFLRLHQLPGVRRVDRNLPYVPRRGGNAQRFCGARLPLTLASA
jgi:hypothetical protein